MEGVVRVVQTLDGVAWQVVVLSERVCTYHIQLRSEGLEIAEESHRFGACYPCARLCGIDTIVGVCCTAVHCIGFEVWFAIDR